MKRQVTKQEGAGVHRLVLGCGDPEPRVLIGQKITPEYMEKLAQAYKAGDALGMARLLWEIKVGREAVAELVD